LEGLDIPKKYHRKTVERFIENKETYDKIWDKLYNNFFEVTARGGLIVIRDDRSWFTITKEQMEGEGYKELIENPRNRIALTSPMSSDYIHQIIENFIDEKLDLKEMAEESDKDFQDWYIDSLLPESEGELNMGRG